jgi:hypothetical protein
MLRASNFGFAIPAGATITGVVAEIERNAGNNNRHSEHTVMLLVDGSEAGTNKSDGSTIPQAKAFKSYGDADDAWGLALTPDIVNASGFGVSFKIIRDANNATTTSVYRIRMTVYYTAPTLPTPAEVHTVYLEQAVPTFTTGFVAADAFVVTTAHARLEAATWTVGDFRSDGQVELGGSVFVENGKAYIAGGGLLKAFVTMPSGSPSMMYTLADKATDFR